MENLLRKIEKETLNRNEKINHFINTLSTNYNSLIYSNGLDELRDLQIFLTDARMRNDALKKQINKIKSSTTEQTTNHKKILNALLQSNLKCSKDFEYIEMAKKTIRVPNDSILKSSSEFRDKIVSKSINPIQFQN